MDFSQYENTFPYSFTNEQYADLNIEIRTRVERFVGTLDQIREFEAALNDWKTEQKNNIRKKYYAEQARLTELFWHDAFDELGIPFDHPKAEKMKAFAWAKGHSAGYSDVFSSLCDIWEVVE